jgi:hypothetical protein
MGCSPFRFSSSQTPDCKGNCNKCNCHEQSQPSPSFPNPDPLRYEILKNVSKKDLLLIKIRYLDCVNYEGNKILLYKNVTLDQLKAQKYIDPHFSESKNYHSPIARFEPTEFGWTLGLATMFSLAHNNKKH